MNQSPPKNEENPAIWLLVAGFLLWSLFVTMTVQGVTLALAWFTDLSKMDLSAQEYLSFGLVQLLLVGIPGLLLLLVRHPRQAAVVRGILLATLAAGLLILPRLLFSPEAAYLGRFGTGWGCAAVRAGVVAGSQP